MTPDQDRIRTAFDRLASIYDEVYSDANDPNLARLRKVRLELYKTLYSPGGWVLDLGCGAGELAIELARYGCRVWAIDLSPGMIELASRRVKAAGLSDRVTLKPLPLERVGELIGEIPAERLDGAYSGLTALNFVNDLEAVQRGLGGLLKPSARLALSALNTRSGFERFYHLTHLRPGRAKERLEAVNELEIPNPDGPVKLPVRYLEPQVLADAFKPVFSVERTYAMAALTPPAGMGDVYRRHARLFDALSRLEEGLRLSPTLVQNAGHYLLVMRRGLDGVVGPHGPHWLANG